MAINTAFSVTDLQENTTEIWKSMDFVKGIKGESDEKHLTVKNFNNRWNAAAKPIGEGIVFKGRWFVKIIVIRGMVESERTLDMRVRDSIHHPASK